MTVASSSPPSRLPLSDARPSAPAKAAGTRVRGDGALAALFIAPALLGFVVFLLWPTLRGIYLSFTRFNLLTPAEWVGLDNYDRMIHDPIFWDSLAVTVEYVVINIGVQTVAALAIAVLLQRLTQSALLRGIVLTPYLMSNVVAGLVWLWILDNQLGIGNEIITRNSPLLVDPNTDHLDGKPQRPDVVDDPLYLRPRLRALIAGRLRHRTAHHDNGVRATELSQGETVLESLEVRRIQLARHQCVPLRPAQ